MNQAIKDFFQDQHQDWVARLVCGHYQHVRHQPPWQNRHWVTTPEGRKTQVGKCLNCTKCDRGEAKDWHG